MAKRKRQFPPPPDPSFHRERVCPPQNGKLPSHSRESAPSLLRLLPALLFPAIVQPSAQPGLVTIFSGRVGCPCGTGRAHIWDRLHAFSH